MVMVLVMGKPAMAPVGGHSLGLMCSYGTSWPRRSCNCPL